ncbi:MAG: hypothetical protein KBI01_07890 [Oscillospiraceae bacterium]|nr:hypothetical protein [Oscillospiraceae bacterium]
MTAEEVIGRLEGDYLERLKWLVLREFRILPGSKTACELSDEDFVLCGAHMVIDFRLRCNSSKSEGGRNSAFDDNRFKELLEGRV